MNTERDAYRTWTHDKLRFGDTDRIGHVNNAVYATFFETGRVTFLYGGETPFAPPGHDFVIVKLTIEFRAEAHYPGTVEIGTRLAGLGSRSFTLEQAAYKGETCIATAESVLVLIGHDTRRAVVLPPELRARLETL